MWLLTLWSWSNISGLSDRIQSDVSIQCYCMSVECQRITLNMLTPIQKVVSSNNLCILCINNLLYIPAQSLLALKKFYYVYVTHYCGNHSINKYNAVSLTVLFQLQDGKTVLTTANQSLITSRRRRTSETNSGLPNNSRAEKHFILRVTFLGVKSTRKC